MSSQRYNDKNKIQHKMKIQLIFSLIILMSLVHQFQGVPGVNNAIHYEDDVEELLEKHDRIKRAPDAQPKGGGGRGGWPWWWKKWWT